MQMPLIGLLRLNKRGEVCEVRRRSPSLGQDTVVVAGIRRHRATDVVPMTLVAFPVTGQDLALMPEGDRITEGMWFFQNVQDPDPIRLNDVIVRHGRAYQVQTAEDWGPYVRAMGKLVDTGQERLL